MQLLVSNLHKSFPTLFGQPLHVLRGVSFSVALGEMVAITGASGAGKSTLLHLIGGIEGADSGSVTIDNLVITNASGDQISQFHKTSVGFVFQFHHLLSDLSATENIAMPLYINREPKRSALRRAKDAFDKMNLGSHAKQPVSLLSGGEQQRVAVARALITDPQLVLADEPTGNLDAAIGDDIAELLFAYCRKRPAGVVIATHNERLARVCDRILHLSDGKLES